MIKNIKTLRDILGSGWSARVIAGELAHKTGLPGNLVEQIIAENHWDRDEILKDIEEARPHEWAVATDERGWMIVDIYTGDVKFIGIVGAKRANYYDVAMNEAAKRNRKYQIRGVRLVDVFPNTRVAIMNKIEGMRIPQVNAKYLSKLNKTRM